MTNASRIPKLERLWDKPSEARYLWTAVFAVVAAVTLKAWLTMSGIVPLNSDEAIVALMARHILQGERPVFFYGQAYMGSLDAWLIAGVFAIFGIQTWVIRLMQGLLYLLTLVSTAWLGRLAFGTWRAGIVALWFLAIPTINLTLYTTASLGGYGEALLIGNLILITGVSILERLRGGNKPGAILWLAMGGLMGLGFWAFGLTLVYTIPMLLYLGVWLWRLAHKSASGIQVTANEICLAG